MDIPSEHDHQQPVGKERPVPLAADSGVVFRHRPLLRSVPHDRQSTDSGMDDDGETAGAGCSPRRISFGAESGYGSPFGPRTPAGHFSFSFTEEPSMTGGGQQQHHYDLSALMAGLRLPPPHEQQQQQRDPRPRVASEGSSFRSIGTMTDDIGLASDEETSDEDEDEDDDDDDDDDDNDSYADDAFYEDGEQEALGVSGAMGGRLPDVIPEAHDMHLPSTSGSGARHRNRAHSVSLPIDLAEISDPEQAGQCLIQIATEFDEMHKNSRRFDGQNETENKEPPQGPQTSSSYPGERGFFAFLRSSLSSRRRQRSQSASDTPPSNRPATPPPPARDAPDAPSTSTQTTRHDTRHQDKFL